MVTSPVIETAVGLLMVFYALALLCAGAVELIATWTRKRAKYLLRGLQDLVDADRQVGSGPPVDPRDWMHDARSEAHAYETALAAGTGAAAVPENGVLGAGHPEVGVLGAGHPEVGVAEPAASPAAAASPAPPTVTVAAIMGHGLVQPFKQTTATGRLTRNPSYLPSGVFSRVLVDLLDDPAAAELSMATLRKRVAAAGGLSAPLQQALGGLARAAGDDVTAFTREVEGWFDAQMDRITGSYKRWAKRWVLVVATVVVLVCGVDSIAIAKALYTQDAVLAAVTQTAPADLCPEGASPEQCSSNAIAFFSEIGLPLGWTAPDPGFGAWAIPLKVLGLLLSIGAAGLGAPFWYRVLDRVGAIRNTGNRPETRSADG